MYAWRVLRELFAMHRSCASGEGDGSSPSRLPESQSAGVSLPEVSLIDPASMTAESSGLSGSASLCFALLQFCDLGVRVLIDSSTLAEFSRLRECRDGIIDLVFSRVRLAQAVVILGARFVRAGNCGLIFLLGLTEFGRIRSHQSFRRPLQ